MFGVCFDTKAQMCWCVSSSEVYGPCLRLSGTVQDDCFGVWVFCFHLCGEENIRTQTLTFWVKDVCLTSQPHTLLLSALSGFEKYAAVRRLLQQPDTEEKGITLHVH